jgi:hypothetical protein
MRLQGLSSRIKIQGLSGQRWSNTHENSNLNKVEDINFIYRFESNKTTVLLRGIQSSTLKTKLVLCSIRFRISSTTYHSLEIYSLHFHRENLRFGLNWFCLSMSSLKLLFWELSFLKSLFWERAKMALVHCFLFEGVANGEPGVQVFSLWWMYYCG